MVEERFAAVYRPSELQGLSDSALRSLGDASMPSGMDRAAIVQSLVDGGVIRIEKEGDGRGGWVGSSEGRMRRRSPVNWEGPMTGRLGEEGVEGRPWLRSMGIDGGGG